MPSSANHRTDLKAVIFDYGEVLCHRPAGEEMSRMAGFFGLNTDQFLPLWERNRGPFDRGDLSAKVYWSMLAADAGVSIDSRQMEELCTLDLEMWSHINSAMIDWVRQLRASGLKVGLLSNMPADMVTHCRKQFAWLEVFDFATFSADVRLIKPDRAIYEYTLRGLGVKPSEAIFLDDREVNIQAARELGMQAIRVQSATQLKKDLQAAGFTILPAIG
jgi:putative hydrolase of the HAD superfamily